MEKKTLNVRKILGGNLRSIRKKLSLTQELLAEAVDLNPRQMSKLETGSHFPSCKTLEALCRTLNVHPSVFFKMDPCHELALTNSYNAPVYKVFRRDDEYYYQQYSFDGMVEEERINKNENFKSFFISKTNHHKNSVIVEFLDEIKGVEIKQYFPDGNVVTHKKFSDKTYYENLQMLLELTADLIRNKDKSDFLLLGLKAFRDEAKLIEFSQMLKGMRLMLELVRNNEFLLDNK